MLASSEVEVRTGENLGEGGIEQPSQLRVEGLLHLGDGSYLAVCALASNCPTQKHIEYVGRRPHARKHELGIARKIAGDDPGYRGQVAETRITELSFSHDHGHQGLPGREIPILVPSGANGNAERGNQCR